VIPERIAAFLRASVKTTWALDFLLLVKSSPGRVWSLGELVSKLRSSAPIVEDALKTFMRLGLITEESSGCYRYAPIDNELDAIVTELVHLYASRPLAVIREIFSAPNDKIQTFVDAFRLKKD
jgi:hypothetical protein